jgi:hypothetical protein
MWFGCSNERGQGAGDLRALFAGKFFGLPNELVPAELGTEIVGDVFEVIHEFAVLAFQSRLHTGSTVQTDLFLWP